MKKTLLLLLLLTVTLFSSTHSVYAFSTLEEGTILPRTENLLISGAFYQSSAELYIDTEPYLEMDDGSVLIETVYANGDPYAVHIMGMAIASYNENTSEYEWQDVCGLTYDETCEGNFVALRTDHLTEEARTVAILEGEQEWDYQLDYEPSPAGYIIFTFESTTDFTLSDPPSWNLRPYEYTIITTGRLLTPTIKFDDTVLVQTGSVVHITTDETVSYTYQSPSQSPPELPNENHMRLVWTLDDVSFTDYPYSGDPTLDFIFFADIEDENQDVVYLGSSAALAFSENLFTTEEEFTLTLSLQHIDPYPSPPQPGELTPYTGLESFLTNLGMYNVPGFLLLFFIAVVVMNGFLLYIKMPSIVFALGNTLIFALFIALGFLPIWLIISFAIILIAFYAVILRQNLFPGGGGL